MSIIDSIEDLRNKINEAVNEKEIRQIIKQATAEIMAQELKATSREQALNFLNRKNSNEELAVYMKNSLRKANLRR